MFTVEQVNNEKPPHSTLLVWRYCPSQALRKKLYYRAFVEFCRKKSNNTITHMKKIRSTTILAIRHKGEVVIAGDGQVSLGQTVIKHNARKVRRLYHDKVITGFAGSTADAFTLYDRLEQKLEQFNGNLMRSSVELAKDWRTDKMLRRLEAMMIAVDAKTSLLLSGSGDVIESDNGILAIGSGGSFAQAAATALIAHSDLDAESVARESMAIAASICVYTNHNLIVEKV
jgi:ATP-dependent HslUV protease subunit HslV